jgi:hypothetical protein
MNLKSRKIISTCQKLYIESPNHYCCILAITQPLATTYEPRPNETVTTSHQWVTVLQTTVTTHWRLKQWVATKTVTTVGREPNKTFTTSLQWVATYKTVATSHLTELKLGLQFKSIKIVGHNLTKLLLNPTSGSRPNKTVTISHQWVMT